MGKNGLSREEEIILVEYQAAQSSAEHHDTLVWTVTSIIWAGNLALLGLVLNVIDKIKLKCWLLAFSVLGIFLCWSVWKFAEQFNKIKRQKYIRCVEIEEILGMKQHSSLRFSGGQRLRYRIITGMLILLWIGVICFILVCL